MRACRAPAHAPADKMLIIFAFSIFRMFTDLRTVDTVERCGEDAPGLHAHGYMPPPMLPLLCIIDLALRAEGRPLHICRQRAWHTLELVRPPRRHRLKQGMLLRRPSARHTQTSLQASAQPQAGSLRPRLLILHPPTPPSVWVLGPGSVTLPPEAPSILPPLIPF